MALSCAARLALTTPPLLAPCSTHATCCPASLNLPASARWQIVQVDAEQLEAEILSRDRPLIIDFYATWCGPCVLLAKELETVSGGCGCEGVGTGWVRVGAGWAQ